MEVKNRVKVLPWRVLGSELLCLLTAVASCQARREELSQLSTGKREGTFVGQGVLKNLSLLPKQR